MSTAAATTTRKRKGGITAANFADSSLDAIKARAAKTQKKSHKKKTSRAYKVKVGHIINFLLLHSLTQCLCDASEHPDAVKTGGKSYWFEWSMLTLLAEHFIFFCADQARKLPSGKIIPEDTGVLDKYRSALFYYRQQAIVDLNVPIAASLIQLYESKLGKYFKSCKNEEQELRQEGHLSAQKGGAIFTIELFLEVCRKVFEFADPRSALFNLMAWHTCGRTVNIGGMHVDHFVLKGDCMGVQFPVTKTNQCGAGNDFILHFFDAAEKPFESIMLCFGIYLLCLTQGPVNGRIFPHSKTPQNAFRTAFKKMFSEAYLQATYQLTYVLLVNHSWRKSALSYLAMASGLKPSSASMDYRAGHSQDWKRKTYYHYLEEGDYEIGRAFIGKVGTKEQSVLPPHFLYEDGSDNLTYIMSCIETCFPWSASQPAKFQACLVRFLAAVVFHSQPTSDCPEGWLQTNFPSHPVLQNPLFTEEGMLTKLADMLGDVHGVKFVRQGIDQRDKVRYTYHYRHIFFFLTWTFSSGCSLFRL